MASPSSKTAVAAAIGGNACVMVAKFVAFLFTGSGAMLSEAIHTLADLINQILLMVGIVRSTRDPDHIYEYGYQSERYVWALISAVGIFFLGCGVTVYHGIQSLLHPHELKDLGWALGVLTFSFVLEAIVLWIAVRAAKQQAEGKPLMHYLRHEADPAVVAVVLEDAAACLGVLVAFAAIVLSRVTGEPYWDAIGSLIIGVLLGVIAIWLIARNTSLLVGASIPTSIRAQVKRSKKLSKPTPPSKRSSTSKREFLTPTPTASRPISTSTAAHWPTSSVRSCVKPTIASKHSKSSKSSLTSLATMSSTC